MFCLRISLFINIFYLILYITLILYLVVLLLILIHVFITQTLRARDIHMIIYCVKLSYIHNYVTISPKVHFGLKNKINFFMLSKIKGTLNEDSSKH